MKQPLFTGTCTALVTPFLNGQVNYPMAEQLLKRQIDAGIKAVVIAGTTGEGATLTDAEKIELVHRSKQYASDHCQIIAGTGSNATSKAIELSQKAEKAGADALLVVSPYYNKTTPDGLIAHYSAIASAVEIPIIVYNVPGRTGIDIPVEVYQQLSAIPNIIGVKEASSSISKISKILHACTRDFYVWTGNDDMILPSVALGAQGVISVVSNVLPVQTNALTQAALCNDLSSARQLHNKLLPLMELLFCEVNPIPVKEAMRLIGFDCGECRLPLVQMTMANRAKLSIILT